jgi:hypothetical protein
MGRDAVDVTGLIFTADQTRQAASVERRAGPIFHAANNHL